MTTGSPSAEHPRPIPLPVAWRRRDRPITLHHGRLELVAGGKKLAAAEGDVLFTWAPDPGVRFIIPDIHLPYDGGPLTLVVPELAAEADVMLTRWNLAGGDVRGTINRARFPPAGDIREIRFAIVNYLFMNVGEGLCERRSGAQRYWACRTLLENDDWRLTFDARSDRNEVRNRLRALSGYEITHTAKLERSDGAAFDDETARRMLFALAHFFGLTAGFWAPPILAYGYDRRRRIIWRDWTPATFSRWRGTMNVIDTFHPDSLQEAFAGFLARWNDPIWRDVLLFGTQFYVEANGPIFAETSLTLAQAALELIAWVRIVEDEKSMTAEKFDKLKYGAAARIRGVLAWLDVNAAVPAAMPALQAEAVRLRWHDGPHAIDWMRNALIHPSKRQRIEDADLAARIELHELALWYVELALLRSIGFNGDYSSRVGSKTAGVVEPVPWDAQPAGPSV